ncbi:septal ring lytic transglycosylase RlpA family protein [Consotaella aegiceratis]|uniref:septal ring lytic transglycosylase RlpA family protein n=1 Tax=Consotaella aegiceratis TaxID=3097961 RepID=UPI002F40A8E1
MSLSDLTIVRGNAVAGACLIAALAALAGCQSESAVQTEEQASIETTVKFSAKSYGVPASPRVTTLASVRKGGGRSHVGKPYKVRGKWYYPKEEPNYSKVGTASWYGPNFHGRLTANGEIYDMNGLSGAHPTFPLPSYARVTNVENGRSVMVRINDRGPFADGRLVDLSSRVADLLDFKSAGTAKVELDYVGRAPVEGDDTQMLLASYRPGPDVQGTDDAVMVASADAPSMPAAANAFAGTKPALPGVRPLDAIQNQGRAAAAVGAMIAPLPTSAPIPLPRDRMVAAFAAQPSPGGAAAAVNAFAAAPGGERIAIGVIESSELRERVMAAASGQGRIVAEPAGQAVSLTLQCAVDTDVDGVLRALWAAGAEDAFVVHD